MTIRGGGRPRDKQQAHPAESQPAAPPSRQDPFAGPAFQVNGAGRRRRSYADLGGGHHLLRFIAFTGILAVLVLVALTTVLRPVLARAVVGWAYDNPSALRIPFVADLVREDLGPSLEDPASDDAAALEFTVNEGDTVSSLVPRLQEQGLIASDRAFVFTAIERDLQPQLKAGTFLVRRNMTPDQLVTALINARIVTIPVTFREGLRLEQLVAKLETVPGTGVDPQTFYDLVTKPPASLLADYPWLEDSNVRPKGATLEGFLYPATYTLTPTSTAEELVRDMLDAFAQRVGTDHLSAKVDGRTFYENLVLASMVEREARLDADRPLIAGVFANRLDPKKFKLGRLQSDVTVFYVNDTLQLRNTELSQWQSYTFWAKPESQLPADLPDDLTAYNTYTSKGLPPGPICSPALPSIQAALAPNTKTGYLYFLATPDGTTVYAKTSAEHEQNVAKYSQP